MSSPLLQKLLKKRPRKLDLDGDEVFVRPLTVGEYLKSQELLRAERWDDCTKFIVTVAVVDADGSPAFTGEDDPQFENLPLDLVKRLGDEILNLSSGGTIEGAKKN